MPTPVPGAAADTPAPAAAPDQRADVWPSIDDLRVRLGVKTWQDPDDEADAQSALDAAVAYVVERSTRYRRNGTDATVSRGTLDLAVSLYERRGSTVDPFDGLTPAQRTAFHRLLGISRHALPFVGGA